RAALNVAKLHDLIGDDSRHVRRNGEPHAGAVVAGTHKGSDDADEVAVEIDESSARIARVDGRIGLDEVLVLLDPNIAPVQSADDAGGHRLPNADRKADGKHKVADLELA